MASIRQLYVTLSLRADSFNNGIRAAQREAREFQKTIRPTVQLAGDVGRALTIGITAPLAAVAAGAIAAGTDFETAFAGVRKTVNATEPEFAALSQQFRDMSKVIPVTASGLADIGAAAGQLGIRTENIASFTKTMAQLGTATNLSATQAATALARFANITQLPQEKIENLGSAIVVLGNNMATTESEIVEFGLRIAGAGKQVGLTEAQIVGFGAALSSVGINAEAGGTAISKVFIELAQASAQGGEKLQGFARVAGVTAAQFSQQFKTDAAGATTAFIEGLGRMSTAGQNVFGVLDDLGLSEIRVRDALLRASGAGDLLRKSIDLASEGFAQNTALTKEAEQRYRTTASQLQLLKNAVTDVGIELFEALGPILRDTVLPLLKQAAAFVSGAAQAFSSLPPGIQASVVVLATLAAAIGPVLLLIASLAPAITTLVGLVGGAAGLTAALASVVAVLTGPVGLAIALGAAVTALGAFLLSNQEINAALVELWTTISQTLSTALLGLKDLWFQFGPAITAAVMIPINTLAPLVKGAWDVIVAIFKGAIQVISGAIKTFVGLITGDWEKMSKGIQQIAKALWDAVKGVFQAGINAVKGYVEGFTSGVTGLFEQMYDKIVGHSIVPDLIRDVGEEFLKLGGVMVKPAQVAANSVTAAFSGMLDGVIGRFTRGIPIIGGLVNTLASSLAVKGLGAIGLGALLPKAAGAAAGIAGGTVAAGTGAAGAGAAGAGGGFGSSIAAFATNPFTIAGAAVLGGVLLAKHFIGRGRESADKFGDQIERPFGADIASLLTQFRSQRDAGTLTIATATAFRDDAAILIRQYNQAASEFAAQGAAQRKVVEQATAGKVGLFGDSFSKVFGELNNALAGIKTGSVGAGIPQTGLALSASNKFSDAVDRLVPALDKLSAGGGSGETVINAPFNPTINITVNDAQESARETTDKVYEMLRTGLGDYREKFIKILSADAGVVTS